MILNNVYQNEVCKLEKYHSFCVNAVRMYYVNQINQIDFSDKEDIIEFLDRLFINELDFLQTHTTDYFQIYHKNC
jgi:hypothetical protein